MYPAQNIMAEQMVFRIMLNLTSSQELAFSQLSEYEFYRESHRTIYRAMRMLFFDGVEITRKSLIAKLGKELEDCGGEQYLDGLYTIVKGDNDIVLMHSIASIKECYKERKKDARWRQLIEVLKVGRR